MKANKVVKLKDEIKSLEIQNNCLELTAETMLKFLVTLRSLAVINVNSVY